MNHPKQETIEKAVLMMNYIIGRYEDQGYPPTVRELSYVFEIGSTSHVSKYLDLLIKAGYLWKDAKGHLRAKLHVRYQGPIVSVRELDARLRQARMELNDDTSDTISETE